MDELKDELINDKRKKVVDKILAHLAKADKNLYYEPTIYICQKIVHCVQEGNLLTQEEKEVTLELSAEDIQILLSYSSNCC